MPPTLALFLCCLFVAYTLRSTVHASRGVTAQLWVPTIWLAIIASRPISFWLNPGGMGLDPSTLEEGSTIDRGVYSVLIILGVLILSRRRLRLSALFERNGWLILFLVYAALSTVWSDFPFVAVKRYIKYLGMITMALVVLTEPDPLAAFQLMLRRCAYVLLPFSLLLIKYYPDLAVDYDSWTGVQMFTGVAQNKNMFGQLLLVVGLPLVWVIHTHIKAITLATKACLIDAFHLFLVFYLFIRIDSKTSLTAFILGIGVFCFSAWSPLRQRIGTVLLSGPAAFLILDSTLGVSEAVIRALGRNPTLTNRTDIWAELAAINSNWVLGAGFDSFWMGDTLKLISRRINEAHNGYFEIVLNLGLVGLALFIPFILSTYVKCRRRLINSLTYGRLSLSLFVIVLIYNIAESGFRGLAPTLFVFFFIGLDVPPLTADTRRPTPRGRPGPVEYFRTGTPG